MYWCPKPEDSGVSFPRLDASCSIQRQTDMLTHQRGVKARELKVFIDISDHNLAGIFEDYLAKINSVLHPVAETPELFNAHWDIKIAAYMIRTSECCEHKDEFLTFETQRFCSPGNGGRDIEEFLYQLLPAYSGDTHCPLYYTRLNIAYEPDPINPQRAYIDYAKQTIVFTDDRMENIQGLCDGIRSARRLAQR